jgi:hypothetical protein
LVASGFGLWSLRFLVGFEGGTEARLGQVIP